MTKIIYFITPKIVAKLGTKAAKFIPVLGPTVEYAKKAQKATQIANPVSASTRRVGLLFTFCFGKAGALSLECIF